jgi:hypothetical protein
MYNNDTQHYGIQNNDRQHNSSQIGVILYSINVMLSVTI